MKGWALNNEMCALGLVSCLLHVYLTAPSDTYIHGQERLNRKVKDTQFPGCDLLREKNRIFSPIRLRFPREARGFWSGKSYVLRN